MLHETGPIPIRLDIRGTWTSLVEHLSELQDKATQVEMEAMRSAVKGFIGQICVARDGMGHADLCLQGMVAGARLQKISIYTQSRFR